MCGTLLLGGTENHEDEPQLGQQESQAKVPGKQYHVEVVGFAANGSLGQNTGLLNTFIAKKMQREAAR